MKDDIEEWIEVVKATCLLAGDWMGYENSPDPDIVDKQNKIFRSTALALKEKSKILLSKNMEREMELKQAIEYSEMAIRAKKEIGKLAQSDEMIVLLYQEMLKLQSKNESLQEEVIYYAEQEAGSSL